MNLEVAAANKQVIPEEQGLVHETGDKITVQYENEVIRVGVLE